VPKLDAAKDMFISREKWTNEFVDYETHFLEERRLMLEAAAAAANQEKGQDNENSASREKGGQSAKMDMVDKEVTKKLKKERAVDGGVRLIKEKSPFMWCL